MPHIDLIYMIDAMMARTDNIRIQKSPVEISRAFFKFCCSFS